MTDPELPPAATAAERAAFREGLEILRDILHRARAVAGKVSE
ncbi:hypothetical protein [Paenirhodobacter populi]|nr:hypothetical protein [Sinirhodobacter populi]